MVFEAISKSLKSIASTTSDMTKKAVDTTKGMGEKALTPFESITKSVTKHIPGLGEDTSLRNQASTRAQKENMISLIQDKLKKFVTATKTVKLPVSKTTPLKKGIDSLIDVLRSKESTQEVIDTYEDAVKTWKTHIETTIPDMYTDGVWSASKKVALTANQQESIYIHLETHIDETKKAISRFQENKGKSTPELETTPDLSHTIEVYRKEEHDIINQLIDKKYEVVTQAKKISYLIRELDRQDRKLETHKNTITKNKITNIISQKIPNHLTVLGQLNTNIDELEKQREESLKKVRTDQHTRLDDIESHIQKNKSTTTSKVATLEKSLTAQTKRTTTSFKKFHSAHTKLWDATLKAPYNQHENISIGIRKEEELYKAWSTQQDRYLSALYTEHTHPYIGIYLSEQKISLQKNCAYDNQLIQKTMKLQLGLINRVNKKQLKAIQDVLTQSQKLNTKTVKLGIITKSFTSLEKTYETGVKAYETRKEKAIIEIKKIGEDIKTYHKAQAYAETSKELIKTTIEKKMVTAKLTYIESETKETAASIKTITEKSKLINKMIKKEKVELEDKQQTLKTISNKKEEKAVADLEHMIQNQELTLDLIKHHLDHEKEHQDQLKEDKKEYISQEKTLKSEESKLNKKEKEQKKLVKKVR